MGDHWVGRGPGRQVHPDAARKIRAVLAAGGGDPEIAAELDCSPALAKKLRLALGLQHRPAPAAPVSDDRIRALHAEGAATWRIAEATGLTVGTVEQRLFRLGLRAHKVEGGPRDRQVSAAVTPEEHEYVTWKAEQEGHPSVSAWLRSLVGLDE